jgi:hypothetical protein
MLLQKGRNQSKNNILGLTTVPYAYQNNKEHCHISVEQSLANDKYGNQ